MDFKYRGFIGNEELFKSNSLRSIRKEMNEYIANSINGIFRAYIVSGIRKIYVVYEYDGTENNWRKCKYEKIDSSKLKKISDELIEEHKEAYKALVKK